MTTFRSSLLLVVVFYLLANASATDAISSSLPEATSFSVQPNHFEWYRLSNISDDNVQKYDELDVIVPTIHMLNKIYTNISQRQHMFDLHLSQRAQAPKTIFVTVEYNETQTQYQLHFYCERARRNEIAYLVDGPHTIFGQYLFLINRVYVDIVHIIENIVADVNLLFMSYIIGLYNKHQSSFSLQTFTACMNDNGFCRIAGEFARSTINYNNNQCKMNGRESIAAICNYPNLLNELLVKMDCFDANDKYVIQTFKIFISKNAIFMDALYHATTTADDELLVMGQSLLKMYDAMIPTSELIKPRWFRYCYVFPLHVKRLILLHNGEYAMDAIAYCKLTKGDSSGIGEVMNDLQLALETKERHQFEELRKRAPVDNEDSDIESEPVRKQKRLLKPSVEQKLIL